MTHKTLLSLACVLWTTSALVLPTTTPSANPTVTIKHGAIIGTASGGVENFKGIPYAEPPLANLRFRPPQPLVSPFGTITSQATPTACPQFEYSDSLKDNPFAAQGIVDDSPIEQQMNVIGEDCLTMVVQRPSGTTKTSKLPVALWIYGGGFEFGSTQGNDATELIQQSVLMGAPILYVAMNYRVGGFGFLAGKELSKEGSTNVGLRDQRLAMQWVQDNIVAFGGDPTRVTIWGESAGAISVFDHLMIHGGDNTYKGKPMFHGAIMNSGSIVPAQGSESPKAQGVYDAVVDAAHCSSAANTLDCLRAAPYETLLNATNSVPSLFSSASLNLTYLPRPASNDDFFNVSPEFAAQQRHTARVPVIIGDLEDEGTLFSLFAEQILDTADMIEFWSSFFVPHNVTSMIAGMVATYPDDTLDGQPDGSPFRTGSQNNVYPQYKRWAAIMGDVTFTLARRVMLEHLTSGHRMPPCWTYLNRFLHGTPAIGTAHASDLALMYGSDDEQDLSPGHVYQQAIIISMVNHGDPNVLGAAAIGGTWPSWTSSEPQILVLDVDGNELQMDDFRQASYEYMLKNMNGFQV